MEDYSPGTVLAWQLAAVAALDGRHKYLEPEHLFIGLCELIGYSSSASLRKLQVPDAVIPSVKAEIVSFAELLSNFRVNVVALSLEMRERKGMGNHVPSGRDPSVHRSVKTKQVFARANEIAQENDKAVIAPWHLMAALLEATEIDIGSWLREKQVDVNGVACALRSPADDTNSMNEYYSGVIAQIMGELQQMIESVPSSVDNLPKGNGQHNSEPDERPSAPSVPLAPSRIEKPSHIIIFMITPFDTTYKPVEEAVRRIFEGAQYCFEVRLARDYVLRPGLLDNVREHIVQADGFIAEISELNPNVMFELGAVMLVDNGRPVFSLRSRDALPDIPADLKDTLFIPYGSKSDPVDRIEEVIRSAFERDGRIVHNGIQGLISQRKKRFLSRSLLENLTTRLKISHIQNLMKAYSTIEDLTKAKPSEIMAITGLQEWFVESILKELSQY